MDMLLWTSRADECSVITEFVPSVSVFAISGEPTPTKFSRRVLNEFVGDETVMESTDNVCGKLFAVFALSESAFQPALVNCMFWFAPGETPRDQEAASSQLPLVGLIQLLV